MKRFVLLILMFIFIHNLLTADPIGWKYKRQITLTPATTENDYQVKVELNSNNFDYTKAKSNGEDLRFYDTTESPLNYWIENWTNTIHFSNSTIWVKVPMAGTSLIYMYYGNTSALKGSDISSTFIIGDDFNDNSFNTTLWTNYGSGRPPLEQNQRLEFNCIQSNPEQYSTVRSLTTFTGSIIFESRFMKGGYVYRSVDVVDNSELNKAYIFFNDWGAIRMRITTNGVLIDTTVENSSWARDNNLEYYLTIAHNPDGTFYMKAVVPESNKSWELTTTAKIPLSTPLKVMFLDHPWQFSPELWLRYHDDIKVRKYCLPEPVATIGNEIDLEFEDPPDEPPVSEHIGIMNNIIKYKSDEKVYYRHLFENDGEIVCKIYDITGNVIKEIGRCTGYKGRIRLFEWNGKSKSGKYCAPGYYILVVEINEKKKNYSVVIY